MVLSSLRTGDERLPDDNVNNDIKFSTVTSVAGMQTSGGSGLIGGLGIGGMFAPAANFIPPLSPIGLQPEPILPPLSRDEYLDALLVSNNSILRNIMATSTYNPDSLIMHKGYDCLDSMKTFAAYYTPLHLLVASALHKEWRIKAKVNGKIVNKSHPRFAVATQIAEFVEYCCRNIVDDTNGYDYQDFQEVIWQALEPGVHLGHSVQEIQYRIVGTGKWAGKFGFRRFIYRQPTTTRFNIDPFTDQIRSLNCQTPLGGWQNHVRREKFLVFTFRKQKGLPFGWGLARDCYKHTFALDILTRVLGEALQRYGMGFFKATITNPTDTFIAKVERYLAQVNSGKPLIETADMLFELIQLSGGALDPIEKAMQYHGQQISQHILGQTLTTSTGGSSGSYALASVHAGTQKYFTGFPRKRIESEMTLQAFTQLVLMNWGPEYLDCVPGLDLGVYDHEERAIISKYIKDNIETGVLHPNETIIRDMLEYPEFDPSTPDELFLPEHEQLRKNINIQQGTSPTGGSS